MGLRADKKDQTRRRLAEVAVGLFLEKGYHAVTTAEIARAAGVSPATLFNYFPTKESLVFDDDRRMEMALVTAVLSRPKGTGVLDALRFAVLDGPYLRFEHDAGHAAFFTLIRTTAELASYARHMAIRYEGAIAGAIAASAPVGESESQAVAHYVIEALFIAQKHPRPTETFNLLIDLFKKGFSQ